MKPREGFLEAGEGADVLQSGFTFSDTESILAPSSCFVSHWMQPFQILSLVPLLSPPHYCISHYSGKKKIKKCLYFCTLSGISILCQTLAASFSVCSQARQEEDEAPRPLDGQHTIVVLHKQLLVFLREARAHLTALRPCLSQKSGDALKASRNTCLTS